jgi:cell wall-associated NlpC family hydrolase
MTTRAEVVACARTWLGTRWQHQARLKGVACDCAGLVIGVAHELGLSAFEFNAYGHIPNGGQLEQLCGEQMTRIQIREALPGDVLLMAWSGEPHHLGMMSEIDGRSAIIHSYAAVRKVVEHDMDAQWWARVVGAYRMPGVG